MIALLAARQAARRTVVETFDRAGATSPATARPLERLGEMDEEALLACIHEGVVREGAPGKFYLYPPALDDARTVVPARWRRARLVKTLAFWLVVLLIPILFITFIDR